MSLVNYGIKPVTSLAEINIPTHSGDTVKSKIKNQNSYYEYFNYIIKFKIYEIDQKTYLKLFS